MIIISFCGGLGNQMFQYALLRKFVFLGKEVKADLSFYSKQNVPSYQLEKIFGIKLPLATKEEINSLKDNLTFLRKVRRFFHIFWKNTDVQQVYFDFNKKIFNLDSAYLEGYWQSEKFFLDVKDSLLEEFSFSKISSSNRTFLKEMKNLNLVSIHVRRGDYESNPHAQKFHGNISTIKYYQKAIEHINSHTKNPFFLIFSNDLDYVEKEFTFLKNKKIVSINKNENSHLDMFLMSQCNHNILANSSFSWWGAYLNMTPNKIVICPKKWVNNKQLDSPDIVPENWIRL